MFFYIFEEYFSIGRLMVGQNILQINEFKKRIGVKFTLFIWRFILLFCFMSFILNLFVETRFGPSIQNIMITYNQLLYFSLSGEPVLDTPSFFSLPFSVFSNSVFNLSRIFSILTSSFSSDIPPSFPSIFLPPNSFRILSS